ncbi:hypothetical protein ACFPOF_26545 [Cohnella soli]|uniref:Uncharacterized protein n=1 Tax=Cohnella soli TaxID=425005 RepID=A0ABW0HYN6_9BACL
MNDYLASGTQKSSLGSLLLQRESFHQMPHLKWKEPYYWMK